ncbi:dephospho-CoA kinase [soil metagenome]
MLEEDRDARAALVAAFGPGILAADGTIDRSALGEAAFATAEGTARLNALVHPPLLARLEEALDTAEREGTDLVAIDAALVFEFGLDGEMDIVVLVTAPRALREERLRRRRGMAPDRIARLMAAQQPDIEKARASDYVIVNDGSPEELKTKADTILAAIRRKHHSREEDRP